ncbi:Fic/DOC family protein [uncultured archaeon]|nr:Fic/DOC family protein [uncultured archaeon]
MVIYITKEEVFNINRNLGLIYGQEHFLQQEANLDHVLDRMQHYAENIMDGDERILKKAAHFLYHVAYTAHAFSDGNKRTALTATLHFLLLNNYVLKPSMFTREKQEELAKFMKDTAEGKNSLSAVHSWLKERLMKFEIYG